MSLPRAMAQPEDLAPRPAMAPWVASASALVAGVGLLWVGEGWVKAIALLSLLVTVGAAWVLATTEEPEPEAAPPPPPPPPPLRLDGALDAAQQVRSAVLRLEERLGAGAMGVQATAGMAAFGAAQSVEQVRALSEFADQMSAEIGSVAEHSFQMAAQVEAVADATGAVQQTVDAVFGLADAISRIAAQTRMLAFNAQIEAARAGEAGPGFAVVAHEVKQLAASAAGTADEIRRTVDALRPRVEALGRSGAVARDAARNIADATSRQAATAAEMSRVIRDAGEAVGSVGGGAEQLAAQGESLSRETEGLADIRGQVDQVLDELRRLAVPSPVAADPGPDPAPRRGPRPLPAY